MRGLRLYETMLIFDAALNDADVEKGITRYTDLVAERGGEIANTDRWGRRRFAQEIDGLFEGYYVVLTYTLPPGNLDEIDKALPFFDGLVRSKTVRPEVRTRRTKRTKAARAGGGA